MTKREALVKARNEWDARNIEQKKKYKAQYEAFYDKIDEILEDVRQQVLEVLSEMTLDSFIDFAVVVCTRDHSPEVRVDNHRNCNDSIALHWSWSVRLDESGTPVFGSSSFSGLCATTMEQVRSLKDTANTLEILMGIDWATLLDVELPCRSDYITENSSIGTRPNFEADIREAEIAELVGTNVLIKGTSSGGRSTSWYFIVSETPKQYKVAVLPPSWVKDEYLQKCGLTIAQVVDRARDMTARITKDKFLREVISNPIKTMTF